MDFQKLLEIDSENITVYIKIELYVLIDKVFIRLTNN